MDCQTFRFPNRPILNSPLDRPPIPSAPHNVLAALVERQGICQLGSRLAHALVSDKIHPLRLPSLVQMDQLMSLAEKRDRLLAKLRGHGSCAVAFSGGVDSAVVAKAAQMALGEKAVAVTGVSASLAQGELERAVELAQLIGIRHEVLQTREFDDANYAENPANRCYFCKTNLYERIRSLTLHRIASGANLDDYRPGLIAAKERKT